MAQVARSLRELGIAAKVVVVYRKTMNGDCFAQMRVLPRGARLSKLGEAGL